MNNHEKLPTNMTYIQQTMAQLETSMENHEKPRAIMITCVPCTPSVPLELAGLREEGLWCMCD